VYLTAITGKEAPSVTWDRAPRYPLSGLERLMAAGADITRSTWDTSSLLIHLDIDYQNSDFPGEAYYHPVDVLFKLEPVFRAVRHLLGRFDLPLLALMTGQGYHFTGRVPLDSDVIDRLADLLPDPPRWLPGVRDRQPRWVTAAVTPRHARAYVGAGMLVEFLAHLILRRAARRAALPIVLNGTVVGSGLVGREYVSLDLSYGGDPMDVRHMRVAFGAYQKHRFRPDVAGQRIARERAPLVAVPRLNDSLTPMVCAGREIRHAARAARSGSAILPVVTDGARRLLAALREIGGSRIVVHVTDVVRDGQNVEERLACCADALRVLARACGHMGVTLLVETPLPHLIGGHPDEFARVVGQLDRSVGVCFDTGHVALGGRSAGPRARERQPRPVRRPSAAGRRHDRLAPHP
jgi:Xylose isomerase-like TIM barrel